MVVDSLPTQDDKCRLWSPFNGKTLALINLASSSQAQQVMKLLKSSSEDSKRVILRVLDDRWYALDPILTKYRGSWKNIAIRFSLYAYNAHLILYCLRFIGKI